VSSSTDPDRFRRVQELFDRALDLTPDERTSFLRRECGDDAALHDEVRALLAADDAPTWTASETTEVFASAWMLPEGARIGSFTIVRSIGEGGMGTVYEATQERPLRTVALKTLRASSDSPKARRRFEYESEILGRMQHPGIAQIYEAGTFRTGEREVPFLAMEMLTDALALDDHIQQRELSPKQILRLFADVCDAVQHAHQHGIVHRDLKPSNLLVDRDGRVKVIDFGIALALDTDEVRRTLRTETGVILGTIAYMSPEQLDPNAGSPDARTDVYSLGVLMFQLLTGRLPHDLDTLPVPTALAIIAERDVPRLTHYGLRGDVPVQRELDWILQKATERDLGVRYQTVAELAADVVLRVSRRRERTRMQLRERHAERRRVEKALHCRVEVARVPKVDETARAVRGHASRHGQRGAARRLNMCERCHRRGRRAPRLDGLPLWRRRQIGDDRRAPADPHRCDR